ncbi:MAG: alpha/beta hydrolase [Clostridium sp.]|nr:alpha/beta hydrolase [Clostridium sp.]
MEEKKSKRSKILTIVGRILIILLIFAGVGLYIFADDYYRPSTTATDALKYSQKVTFLEQDGDLIFTPDEIKGGVIIYPGGKVSEKAYGYLAHKIADMGYKTIVVKVPLKLSILSNNAGKKYLKDDEVDQWAVMGHSLGGISASRLAKRNNEVIEALILLASYPDNGVNLKEEDLKVFSLVGDKDGVINEDQLETSRARLPDDTIYTLIPGGNHASFGNYGVQEGDNLPDISYDEQQDYVLEAVKEAFK